jgi:hypothetical protein
MLKETQTAGTYLQIIGGKLRKSVPEGTPGAIRRDWETKDGKKGTKFEKEYESLTGVITGLNFYDGEFGKNLTVFFKDGEEDYGLSMGVATQYAEDFMKKLPNVNLEQEVMLIPYDFEDDKGRRHKGITVSQSGVKLKNFFYDTENKKQINGAPSPEGNVDLFDSEDWKMYFTKHRKFTINYITEKIIPKLTNNTAKEVGYGNKLDDFDSEIESPF